MYDVETARAKMLAHGKILDAERIPLAAAANRTLAASLAADRDQPPFRASAMDGFAVRSSDMSSKQLTVVGLAAAGKAYDASLGPGEAVRILTGAPVPEGADQVLPQERVICEGPFLTLPTEDYRRANIRAQAVDFATGTVLVEAGTRLRAGHLALLAAAGIDSVSVRRAPSIAMIATGNEIVRPGVAAGPYEIYDAVTFGLGALIEEWGGSALQLDVQADDEVAIVDAVIEEAGDADLVVVVGGASVGDYDLARRALERIDLKIEVPQINVRPGKPTWFGVARTPILGLPGNPAAALVCAHLFLRPLIDAMLGRKSRSTAAVALLDGSLSESSESETYLRASVRIDGDACLRVHPLKNQDTSLLTVFSAANALIRRPPNRKAAARGERVEILPLSPALVGDFIAV
jgi:molybdopterin molybdotransferase